MSILGKLPMTGVYLLGFLLWSHAFDSLEANAKGQFLFGWAPNPGTAFYLGYDDDVNRRGFNPFTGQLEPGLRRNGRTFFIKMSYLFRRGLGQ